MEYGFTDFVGNKHVIKLVKLMIHKAESNKSARIPDMAFLGPSGHGKTMLSRIVANHLKRRCIEINATVVSDPFVFRSLIVSKEAASPDGTIIFVDECHALKKKIQTNLLSATQDPRKLHTSSKDQVYRDSLPDNFSFIFATTHRNYIIPELFNRLTTIEFMEYSLKEKCEIIVKLFINKYKVEKERLNTPCVVSIAKRSRSARDVVNNCEKIIMNMEKNNSKLTEGIIEDTFDILQIDENGLTKIDRKLLGYLAKRGAPVGLETLGDLLLMPKKDVKKNVEPFLLRNNYMARKSAGRIITNKGLKAIGVTNNVVSR